MNRNQINSCAINSDVTSSLQSVIVYIDAFAVISSTGNAWRRSSVVISQLALIEARLSSRQKTEKNIASSALLKITGLSRIRLKAPIDLRVNVGISGAIAQRRNLSQPTSINQNAVIWKKITIGVRSPCSIDSICAFGVYGKSYSYVDFARNISAKAEMIVNFNTRKQIPYIDDAPGKRTILVQSDNRIMVV